MTSQMHMGSCGGFGLEVPPVKELYKMRISL